MTSEKKLFLLDAMALIYRAFYAMNKNPRFNSKGLNTSAILGFANTLYDIIHNEQPTHIGVAFDTMAPTLRHEEFEAYKANREEMPEDLSVSIPYIKKLIEAFNIPVILYEGYEADDVIGTLAKKAETQGFTTYMMTSDKDFGQLVSDRIFVYKPPRFGEKAEIMGVKEVCEKYSIQQPEQLIDILGLWGDASDNIPGIPGVGEVTAKKLISEFGSIENLIASAENISNIKLREKVITYKDQAMQSKGLATIITNVPVEFSEEQLRLKLPHQLILKELLDELEFRNFSQRVFGDLLQKKQQQAEQDQPDLFGMETKTPVIENSKNTILNTSHEYIPVETTEKRKELAGILSAAQEFCFDTETSGTDPNTSELVSISFSVKAHQAYFIRLSPDYHSACEVLKDFRHVFENKNILKIGQNLKFDMEMLRWYDIEVQGPYFDTMLAHYLIEPDLRHNMDFLAETYLNYTPVSIESLIGKKGKGQMSMALVEDEQLKEYSCEDADVTLQLKHSLLPLLEKKGVLKLFQEVEIPLIPVLASMETEGVKIDTAFLNEYSMQLGEEIKKVEKEIYELSGCVFNISSPKQLGEILYDKLKIVDNPKKTATKQYSTAEDVLSKMAGKHPVIDKVLDYRSLTKLKSTYVDSLPDMVNPRTGRIHTSFNQAVAATGRLSSNNPNLQNIPIRTEKGREIRKAFIPRNQDYLVVSSDYSQIELRIIASISNEIQMIEDFKKGLDIHAATAARVYNVPLTDVTREMRRNAKTVNFGIIYGISAFGLSERLSIPRKEAAEIIEQYFIKYPAIKKYMDDTIIFARSNGYVETLCGRRRYLRDINSGNAVVRGYAERNAINAPIQGSAADMIKIAMIRIYQKMTEKNLKSRMTLQVHDELVFDVYKPELELILPLIREEMLLAFPLQVPVEVEISSGNNWLEAH